MAAEPVQHIVFNGVPGQGMYQGQPESVARKAFGEVVVQFPNVPDKCLTLQDVRVKVLSR
jgi:hypothetical protein